MANIEINAASTVCRKCGRAYGRLKGYFPASYADLYKGTGYLPYCWECINKMHTGYLTKYGDHAIATEQVCRKLDLYWSPEVYRIAAKRTNARSLLTNYFTRLTNAQYAGKCYEDTLREFGACMSTFMLEEPGRQEDVQQDDSVVEPFETYVEDNSEPIEITNDIVSYWGPGYTAEMYQELERRLQFYRKQLGEDTKMDLGTETLLRQIAMMEIDINRARADGRSVEKMVTSLNALISSLKRPQKNAAADTATANTPFGVWIKRWEDERPLPEIDDSMKDVDGIARYVLTWVYGHLAHMLKIKNARAPLYEDAVARLRVEHPEYNDDDDETMLAGIYGEGDDDDKDV